MPVNVCLDTRHVSHTMGVAHNGCRDTQSAALTGRQKMWWRHLSCGGDTCECSETGRTVVQGHRICSRSLLIHTCVCEVYASACVRSMRQPTCVRPMRQPKPLQCPFEVQLSPKGERQEARDRKRETGSERQTASDSKLATAS